APLRGGRIAPGARARSLDISAPTFAVGFDVVGKTRVDKTSRLHWELAVMARRGEASRVACCDITGLFRAARPLLIRFGSEGGRCEWRRQSQSPRATRRRGQSTA